MNHEISSVPVYFTKEYGRFNIMVGNRQINEAKVNKLVAAISEGLDLLKVCPIICYENKGTGKLDIIDGQHRFFACKQIRSSVWYVLTSQLTIEEIAMVNSIATKWNTVDFLESYVAAGNPDYKKVLEFKEKYSYPLSTSLRLLHTGELISDTGFKMEKFRAGEFKVLYWSKANEIATVAIKFKWHKFYKRRHFIAAVSELLKDIPGKMEALIKRFNKNPDQLEIHHTSKAYVSKLKELYL